MDSNFRISKIAKSVGVVLGSSLLLPHMPDRCFLAQLISSACGRGPLKISTEHYLISPHGLARVGLL